MLFSTLVVSLAATFSGLHDPTSLTKLSTGYQFTEGPVWRADGGLLFTDIPASRIHTGTGSIFREPSGQANGLTLDREGRLIAAEHETRRVTRTEKDGSVAVLADHFEGKFFNSPNDVVVRSDGVVFFTDPPYGLPGGMEKSALGFSGVFAVNPDSGSVQLVGKDFNKPNGLCLSPDESKLYVADTEGDHDQSGGKGDIWAFERGSDGHYTGGKVFCKVATPDGIKADVQGNLWVTCTEGVLVFDPKGSLLEKVIVPEEPTNCAFGGVDGKTLFITARTSVYTVKTSVVGLFPSGRSTR